MNTWNNANAWRTVIYNLSDTRGPDHRGAPYPPFNPLYINEECIPDNMRCRYIQVDTNNNDFTSFSLNYVTQDEFDSEDFEKFCAEVKRCILYNLNYYIKDYYNIEFKVEAVCRDGYDYGYGKVNYKFDNDPDTFLEEFDTKDKYYYGVINGNVEDYFDGDYFEIICNDDKTYSWQDCELYYQSGDKKFNSRLKAKQDAIKTIETQTNSKLIVNQDPNIIYNTIYGQQADDDIIIDDTL